MQQFILTGSSRACLQVFISFLDCSGVDYVDVEARMSSTFRKAIVQEARAAGCAVVMSDHCYLDSYTQQQVQV